jgi:hypothetical protein
VEAVSHFNICSNTTNQCGLQADSELLRDLLESWGHTVKLIHYRKRNEAEEAPPALANIFIEVVNYDLVARNVAKHTIMIPNPEWFAAHDHRAGLRQFDLILCKTHDAVNIMTKLAECKPTVRYIGFEAKDLYDPTIPRERKFLHVAGQSRYKNTMATTFSFARMMDDEDVKPLLTIIGCYVDEYAFALGTKNIITHERVSDEELKQLMNSHLFHVMAAGYEGYGQSLHESLGVGAVLLTTNHPPMSEFNGVPQDLLIPYQDTIPELAAMRARVVAAPIRDVVKKALRMKPERIEEIQREARAAFLADREAFRAAFKREIDSL